MKLINYLLSENKKGWQWPNNVVIAVVMKGDRGVNFYFDYTCPPTLSETLISPHPFTVAEVVTREQYEAALAARKPDWDGDGLPPVGCECEWQDKNTKLWFPVVIAYSSEWVTVVRELKPLKVGDAVECCINNFGEEERLHFRPIRSEAERKRDAAAEAIDYWMPALPPTQNKFYHAKKLYDAIAAGKIPHIRID